MYERKIHKALGYPSWEAFADERFGWGKAHFYQVLQAAKVEQNIKVSDISDTLPAKGIPISQARELAKLPPDLQVKAYEQVTAINDGTYSTPQMIDREVSDISDTDSILYRGRKPTF